MKHSDIEVKPIRTKMDYERTMKIIESLLSFPPESKEAEMLEVLSILADDYENKHFPIEAPDPIEAIKYRMEQLNMTQKDLSKYLGGENRASEILNHKRPLTLKMIVSLCQNLQIPAATLLSV